MTKLHSAITCDPDHPLKIEWRNDKYAIVRLARYGEEPDGTNAESIRLGDHLVWSPSGKVFRKCPI